MTRQTYKTMVAQVVSEVNELFPLTKKYHYQTAHDDCMNLDKSNSDPIISSF